MWFLMGVEHGLMFLRLALNSQAFKLSASASKEAGPCQHHGGRMTVLPVDIICSILPFAVVIHTTFSPPKCFWLEDQGHVPS